MKYVFAKTFLPLALLASSGAQAQLTLELDTDTPLNLSEARYNAAIGVLEAKSVLSQTESFVACFNTDGQRADVDPQVTPAGLIVEIDGNPYELFDRIVYSTANGPVLKVESANGPLTCRLSGETDLQLAFDGPDHGEPVRLRRAVQFAGANPSPLITNDVVICSGQPRANTRDNLNLDLQPWFPGLSALYDTQAGPILQDWVDAGFGPMGDVFGSNTVRYGDGGVLTVETRDGFSCRTFPVADTETFSAGLSGDDWFQACVNPDGIFCDAFQRDEALDGLSVVIERIDVSTRADLNRALPGDVVEIQLRAINLGAVPANGRVRWYPMMEVCPVGEACSEIASVSPVNYDIQITNLSSAEGADEFLSDTAQFVIPQTAQPGDRFRIVAASFLGAEVDPRPSLTRAQLVIEVQ